MLNNYFHLIYHLELVLEKPTVVASKIFSLATELLR